MFFLYKYIEKLQRNIKKMAFPGYEIINSESAVEDLWASIYQMQMDKKGEIKI